MIDLKELALSIQSMTRRQELYKVLKEELTRLGYWKNAPRGKPFEGYRKSIMAMQPKQTGPVLPIRHLVKEIANEKALARANRCCEVCGSRYGLIVHHKEPLIDGENRGYNEKNSPDNLMVLCRSCHDKQHRS